MALLSASLTKAQRMRASAGSWHASPVAYLRCRARARLRSAYQTQNKSRSSLTTISASMHVLHWLIASKIRSGYSCGTTLTGSRHCAALCSRLCVRGVRIMASASTTRIRSRCVFSACALLTSSRALTCDARQEKKITDCVKISINHNDKRAVFVHDRSKPFKCSKLWNLLKSSRLLSMPSTSTWSLCDVWAHAGCASRLRSPGSRCASRSTRLWCRLPSLMMAIRWLLPLLSCSLPMICCDFIIGTSFSVSRYLMTGSSSSALMFGRSRSLRLLTRALSLSKTISS